MQRTWYQRTINTGKLVKMGICPGCKKNKMPVDERVICGQCLEGYTYIKKLS